MKKNGLKYIFFITSAFILILMIFLSRDAGISCDDTLHYDHSIVVYNYFATHGQDRSALETPVTHLKYYGQSYDNIVTVIIKWFGIEDVYRFRHLMSSISGWLAIFITALAGVWLSGYGTGIIILLLFAVSPTFIGHSLNNLKDIPFALSYIAGIFFMLKMLKGDSGLSRKYILPLILSIGFSISIRPVGILLICYLFLFWFVFRLQDYFESRKFALRNKFISLVVMILISGASFFLGILLWPYALQSPVRNVLHSYHFMAHFPDTFRQIFEGVNEWSDFMPWYYIPKSMAITIPLIVTAGTALFLIFIKTAYRSGKFLHYLLIIFTIIFPLIFVIAKKSNLYSSWRQFLFLYPPLIIVASTGFNYLAEFKNNRYIRWGTIAVILLLCIHPVRYMIKDHPYEYIYYNQFVGGLKGAYGNYETDYYYVSQTESSAWLINYLQDKKIDSAVIGATYPVKWSFRKHPGINTFYFRNEERSQYNWDYAIIANRYIHPFQLNNGIWPPGDVIHTIYADEVPIGIVLERKNKDDYYGYMALEEGRSADAINHFETALKYNFKDEMIFYNFARALYNEGFYEKADSALKKALEINPYCEPVLMYLGNIAKVRNNTEDAVMWYERLIDYNRKYFQAYVELSELYSAEDVKKARKILRDCLKLNPWYKPAIVALADTYRESDPEKAAAYYEIADTIN